MLRNHKPIGAWPLGLRSDPSPPPIRSNASCLPHIYRRFKRPFLQTHPKREPKPATERRPRRRLRDQRSNRERPPARPRNLAAPRRAASRCLARWLSPARRCSRRRAARSPARPPPRRRSQPLPPSLRRRPRPPDRRSAPSLSALCSATRHPRRWRPSRRPLRRWHPRPRGRC
jgi:hypothetical protein